MPQPRIDFQSRCAYPHRQFKPRGRLVMKARHFVLFVLTGFLILNRFAVAEPRQVARSVQLPAPGASFAIAPDTGMVAAVIGSDDLVRGYPKLSSNLSADD